MGVARSVHAGMISSFPPQDSAPLSGGLSFTAYV
jgi:hypothetical protein